ncbi:hypothetical protein [Puia dinghuensis]|uniref:Uncharacterized protein n=1 Tax=Puia dinghuensis TaxID=1792502 RepID=A0A8J2XSZ4_9BACT|nr:hypothetical protein [Puia dinghuensis]GGA99191.1 hypothetical protein GCM10011511_23130 [Puia dinghuensis]
MQKDQYAAFFKALMTGLFIGIIDTLICLSYNIGYRNSTGFIPSEIINVSSLIFAVNLLMTIVGIVYFFFIRFIRNGDIVYTIFMLALTAWLAYRSFALVRFSDAKLDGSFHGLLGGIVLILGISAASLSFFYRSKKFQEAVI